MFIILGRCYMQPSSRQVSGKITIQRNILSEKMLDANETLVTYN